MPHLYLQNSNLDAHTENPFVFPNTCEDLDDVFGSTAMSNTDKKLAQKCLTTVGKEEEEVLLSEVSLTYLCTLNVILSEAYRT